MKGKMKAQVFYEANVMKLEEIDIPQIADNEVLVKVKATGICGSDISYYYGHSPLGTADGKGPLVLGHEFSGEIAEVGALPKKLGLFKEGDRVTCNPVVQCNACENCAKGRFNVCSNATVPGVSVNGAFAEYCKLSYTHVYKIPDTMSYEEAAVIEPLACGTYGVKKLDVEPGDFVVVFGPGPIGIMMTQLIKASGAGKVAIVGTRDYPLETALSLGADYAVNIRDTASKYYAKDVVERISELTGGQMADRVIVPTSSKEALQNALTVSGAGATIVYFGLPGPDDKIEIPALSGIQSDKTIKFAWLAPLVWPTAIRSVANGLVKLDKLITHRFPLADAEKGIQFMKNGKGDKLKGIVVF
jgi:threonine dehydrogenase-like Zn-dependent dehydrogenase